MRKLAFGRVKRIVLVNGQPRLDPPPGMYRDCRLTGQNQGGRTGAADFLLKQQVLALLAAFDRIGTGVVEYLEVRDGLPTPGYVQRHFDLNGGGTAGLDDKVILNKILNGMPIP